MCLKNFESIQVGAATVFHGSNLDVLPFMADNSVDSIVCDPPYELGFMGKKWDSSGIAYSVDLWSECLRVLKPGGHLLAFGGSRTWHRLAVAIEDAGFEVRDSIAWLYGSGFPKSHNVALGIDKKLGHENRGRAIPVASKFQASDVEEKNKLVSNPVDEYLAKTDDAKKWAGWGTALKPAFEPVVVARKPLVGTVAENVLVWGVGGLNIDASRIDFSETETDNRVGTDFVSNGGDASNNANDNQVPNRHYVQMYKANGRWPANIILDEYTAGLLDEQSGESKSGKPGIRTSDGFNASTYGSGMGIKAGQSNGEYGDSGGASRFFYVAKANKRDRNEGLDELDSVPAAKMVDRKQGSAGMNSPRAGAGRTGGAKNFHPTVKPTDLMRYLIKLVTPAGGIVFDPFTGSGSTGKAALLDGFQFIGIELTADYLPIIEGRLRWAEQERINQVSANEVKEKETLF
jgi:site-specific DNA-methyltransferase (adenine-specific)